MHSLRRSRALAVARALWLARDEYAREIDTAPLLPDVSVTAATEKTLAESRKVLAALKEFHGRANRSELPRWWAAIKAGMATEDIPPARVHSDSTPPVRAWSDRRLKAARATLTEVSERLSIPVGNLLTPAILRRLAWEPPELISEDQVGTVLNSQGARPWQRE